MCAKYKFAVLGVGGRGSGWARDIAKHKDCEVVAVSDINEGRAKNVAEKVKAKAYMDYRELLEKESLDACVIASPHYMHAPMTIYAAENDVHVLCEKPMATNLQECDNMIIAARKNDVKLAIGFQHHFSPVIKYLHDAVRGAKGELGDLGRITDILMTGRHYRGEMYYLMSTPVDPKTGVSPGPWRGRWETEGAGILINQAVHNIDAFQYIAGPIKSVSAYAKTISKEHKFIEVEDTVSVSMELENGALGTMIMSSANKKSEENKVIIHGENGYIYADGGFCANFVRMDTRYKDEEDYEIPIITDPKWNLLDNFLQAIEEDTEPLVNGEEGRKSIELIRAILISSHRGTRVTFPVSDDTSIHTITNMNRFAPPEL
ncbi:MAG: Gfo/Idh/MocA family protein [Promethearchaeota archaeon]